MTRRGMRERLEDIQIAAQDALEFSKGLDEATFIALPTVDRRTYRALKNVLSEIGEAVKQLPPELLARHPEIGWRGWAGLRDVVSHQYFNLELPLLRPTIVDELPILLRVVGEEISKMTKEIGSR
jgi:uncharacterized protein with HEPN domain